MGYLIAILVLLLIAIGVALHWIFRSEQTAKPRTVMYAIQTTLRVMVVYTAAFTLVHMGLGIQLPMTLAVLVVLVVMTSQASIESVLGGGTYEVIFWCSVIAPFVLTKEFVLGFPVRDELILAPEIDSAASHDQSHLHASQAIVTSPLRPLGTVQIEGEFYSAKSQQGNFIEVGVSVTVQSTHGDLLVVTRDSLSIP